MRIKGFILMAMVLLATLTGFVGTQDDLAPRSTEIIGVRAVDIWGKVHNIGVANKQVDPVAIVFIDIGCVISQRMIPKLNRHFETAEKSGVQFYGVISNPKVKWSEAQEFAEEYQIDFPLLLDASGDLAYKLNPSVVPECYVIDKYDELLYFGRIDDQFVDIGKYNKEVRSPDLLNAIEAASRGAIPEVRHQTAKGCIFESWNKPDAQITFNQHIEPIIRANCSSCHKPNEIAPFSLVTYEDVMRRAQMVEYVAEIGYMPIWKGQANYGKFANEHRLSDYQIDLIKQWVAGGLEEGKPESLLPAPKMESAEWKLGEPDIILKMEPYDLPADGDDQYRVFVMKDALPKGKVVKALEFKPGDPEVVHHSTVFVDYEKKLRKYDAEDPKPGYDAFEKGGTMEFGGAVPIAGWAPGVDAYLYPENVGFYLEGKADLAFENHYHLSGKATTDQSYVGIYFADEPVNKYITGSIIGTQRLHIPAGESKYQKSIWTHVPVDIELFDFTPHMHYIGTEVDIKVLLPDGQMKPLLNISDWDLRWQSVYTLRELAVIPAGSTIIADFIYDNSDDNHDNPFFPAQDIFWGWESNDEMCEVYFSYIPVNYDDYGKMLSSSFASFEHSYSHEERIQVGPNNSTQVAQAFAKCDLWSHEGQTYLMSIVESAYGPEVVKAMEKQKNEFQGEVNYATNLAQLRVTDAYFSLNESKMYSAADKSASELYELLKDNPTDWNTNFTLGKLLLESGEWKWIKEGVKLLEELRSNQKDYGTSEKHARLYWELGKYQYIAGDDSKAEEVLKEGLELFPTNEDLNQELASEGRIVKRLPKTW